MIGMARRKVAVLGATGTVGQRMIQALDGHPWFELAELAASERSAGRRYADAVEGRWKLEGGIPDYVRDMPVLPCSPDIESSLVFSALDSGVAGPIEDEFADAGHYVCSNAKNHRMEDDVPLVIPEVNPGHLEALEAQKSNRGRQGFVVTNPNCSTIGLVVALKPLDDAYGARRAHVVTSQAISGAGYPGVASLDIHDNLVPYISGEEEKMEAESRKLLGSWENGFRYASMGISAQCSRVPVIDGHMEFVFLGVDDPADVDDAMRVMEAYRGKPQELGLPTAPEQPVIVFRDDDRPQPRLDRYMGSGRAAGMAVSVGRLREDTCDDGLFDYKFVVLSHNTVRGAAGAAVLNAELLEAEGYLR